MATITRSVIRSATSIRNAAAAAAKLSSEAGASRSSSKTFRFAASSKNPSLPSRFLLRSPVEMSCCIETLLPLHTATSSAVLTSLLSVARPGYGWLSEEFAMVTCYGHQLLQLVAEFYSSNVKGINWNSFAGFVDLLKAHA